MTTHSLSVSLCIHWAVCLPLCIYFNPSLKAFWELTILLCSSSEVQNSHAPSIFWCSMSPHFRSRPPVHLGSLGNRGRHSADTSPPYPNHTIPRAMFGWSSPVSPSRPSSGKPFFLYLTNDLHWTLLGLCFAPKYDLKACCWPNSLALPAPAWNALPSPDYIVSFPHPDSTPLYLAFPFCLPWSELSRLYICSCWLPSNFSPVCLQGPLLKTQLPTQGFRHPSLWNSSHLCQLAFKPAHLLSEVQENLTCLIHLSHPSSHFWDRRGVGG